MTKSKMVSRSVASVFAAGAIALGVATGFAAPAMARPAPPAPVAPPAPADPFDAWLDQALGKDGDPNDAGAVGDFAEKVAEQIASGDGIGNVLADPNLQPTADAIEAAAKAAIGTEIKASADDVIGAVQSAANDAVGNLGLTPQEQAALKARIGDLAAQAKDAVAQLPGDAPKAPADQHAGQPADQHAGQPADQHASQPADQPADQNAGQPADQAAAPNAGQDKPASVEGASDQAAKLGEQTANAGEQTAKSGEQAQPGKSEASKSGKLAYTGAGVLVPVGIAGLALVGLGTVLVIRRRRATHSEV